MPARSPNRQAGLYISMRRQVGLAEDTTTMLSYLIVSGLCLLVLLHTVRKVWQNALEIPSPADNLDKTRGFTVRGQQAANDSELQLLKDRSLESSPRNTAMSGNKAMTPQTTHPDAGVGA
jgi:hypothetical protein